MSERAKKLLDRVRDALRAKHYSIRTEQAYVDWIKRYILFHDKRHPRQTRAPEIEAFLIHLAIDQNVIASWVPNLSVCTASWVWATRWRWYSGDISCPST